MSTVLLITIILLFKATMSDSCFLKMMVCCINCISNIFSSQMCKLTTIVSYNLIVISLIRMFHPNIMFTLYADQQS